VSLGIAGAGAVASALLLYRIPEAVALHRRRALPRPAVSTAAR
jgi:hypothetical protein